MNLDVGIKSRCHINTNADGDRFVGLKADTDDAVVYFPLGYRLPESEQEIKRDILHLFAVLAAFTDKNDKLIQVKKFEAPQTVDFPINAYMEIINYYMDNGYYMEKDPVYKTKDRGKVSWTKTIQRQRPLLQQNPDTKGFSPVYTKYTVRESTPNENKEITRIHQHCVYESFSKMGWIFTPYMPPMAEGNFDVSRFLVVLRDKLGNTNNDKEKRLFQSMIEMLKFLDEKTSERQFYFGTDNFEGVWERLIDRVFGIKNKDDYFPKAKWRLRQGRYKEKRPLQPDTIMIYGDKIYVLDAKYYKYGATKNPDDLPNAASINKQITYGEYIYQTQSMQNENLYNAFLMPYNMADNMFDFTEPYENVGEAYGEWKGDNHYYERIQGILVDVRYLMYHYTGNPKRNIMKLAASIEKALKENNGLLPGMTADES